MIYEELLQKVRDGARFRIDFRDRLLKINGKQIPVTVFEDFEFPNEPVLRTCERLYEDYKHSIPSEHSESRGRRYFRALKERDMEDGDMYFGTPRMEAQFTLEYFILAAIVRGKFVWTDDMGKWFWQSKVDKDLVILKEWIV